MKYDNLDDVARSAVTLPTPVSERIGGQYRAIGKRLCDLLLAALIPVSYTHLTLPTILLV